MGEHTVVEAFDGADLAAGDCEYEQSNRVEDPAAGVAHVRAECGWAVGPGCGERGFGSLVCPVAFARRSLAKSEDLVRDHRAREPFEVEAADRRRHHGLLCGGEDALTNEGLPGGSLRAEP
jgi:hypothetical protein